MRQADRMPIVIGGKPPRPRNAVVTSGHMARKSRDHSDLVFSRCNNAMRTAPQHHAWWRFDDGVDGTARQLVVQFLVVVIRVCRNHGHWSQAERHCAGRSLWCRIEPLAQKIYRISSAWRAISRSRDFNIATFFSAFPSLFAHTRNASTGKMFVELVDAKLSRASPLDAAAAEVPAHAPAEDRRTDLRLTMSQDSVGSERSNNSLDLRATLSSGSKGSQSAPALTVDQPERKRRRSSSGSRSKETGECSLCTVTFHANRAHNLTRSP